MFAVLKSDPIEVTACDHCVLLASNHAAAYNTLGTPILALISNRNSLHTMPPKNTRNLGYHEADPTDAPHRNVETDSSPNKPSQSVTPPKPKHITTSDNPEDDVVTVSRESTPSPTASDILVGFPLEDIQKTSYLDLKMLDEDMSAQERKRRLLELRARLDNERMVWDRSDDEEREKI
jgi:hypothetical protein